jgi:signal transduction histidine kinase
MGAQQGHRQDGDTGPIGVIDNAIGTNGRRDYARLPYDIHGISLLSDKIPLITEGISAAGMAHDLGNLLQIVASAVGLIDRRLDQVSRSDLRTLTQGALVSVDRAAALSRRIFDRSQSETLAGEMTCLATTVLAIADLIHIIVGPSIQVEFRVRDDVPWITANTKELENVIFNLVINARDAMPDGGLLAVSVYADVSTSDNDEKTALRNAQAVLCVSDTGCGMPADVISQVFQPFFTTKPAGKGTGIGLATVSSFARKFGGSTEIRSKVGVGTSVVLRMPCECARLVAG